MRPPIASSLALGPLDVGAMGPSTTGPPLADGDNEAAIRLSEELRDLCETHARFIDIAPR